MEFIKTEQETPVASANDIVAYVTVDDSHYVTRAGSLEFRGGITAPVNKEQLRTVVLSKNKDRFTVVLAPGVDLTEQDLVDGWKTQPQGDTTETRGAKDKGK